MTHKRWAAGFALALTLDAAIGARTGSPCSIVESANIEERTDLSPGAEFRVWHTPVDEYRIELRDEKGRPISSRVMSYVVPQGSFYGESSLYVVLRTAEPPPKGRYELRFGFAFDHHEGANLGKAARFAIASDTGAARPAPPTGLTVRLGEERCRTGHRADCSLTYGDCRFVYLQFQDKGIRAERPRVVYEMSTLPVSGERRDEERRRRVQGFISEPVAGGRVIKVPVEWFDDVREGDTEVRFELRAIDDDGRTSAPVSAALPARSLITPAKENTHTRPYPFETRYVENLAGFIRAAEAGSAEVFELLAPVRPQLGGRAGAWGFDRALRAAAGRVVLRARLRGHEARTRVRMEVPTMNGRVTAPVALPQMKDLLSQLPLDEPEVRRIDLWVTPRLASIVVDAERAGTAVHSWKPQQGDAIRQGTRRRLVLRDLMERHPLYKAFVAKIGKPSSVYYWTNGKGGEVGFGGHSHVDKSVRLSFSASEARIVWMGIGGHLVWCRVGSLAPAMDAVIARLGLGQDTLEQAHAGIAVDEGGGLRIQVTRSVVAAIEFTGQLDSPEIVQVQPAPGSE